MIAGSTKANEDIDRATKFADQLPSARRMPSIYGERPQTGLDERVQVVSSVYIPTESVTEQSVNTGIWLKEIQGLGIGLSDRGVPVSQVLAQLSSRGINISSDLPLHSYLYSGVINMTDAETFLKIVLGTVGLDFEPDDVKRSITVRPLREKTWYFNVSKSTGSMGGGEIAAAPQPMMTPNGGNQQYGMPQGGAMMGAQQSLQRPAGGASPNDGGSGFWGALEKELKERLSVPLPQQQAGSGTPVAGPGQGAAGVPGAVPAPIPSIPGAPTPQMFGQGGPLPPAIAQAFAGSAQPAAPLAGGLGAGPRAPETGIAGFQNKMMGSYSINPDTGAVTVKAPRWLLDSLDPYFAKVRSAQNAEISYEGLLILVANDNRSSEGFDIQGFTKWLGGKYQFFAANNSLGGVTLSFPEIDASGVARATAGKPPLNGPLLGINKPDGLRLFNAYLQERGGYNVVQRPLISTTSGTTASFERTTTKYYNTVTQQVGQSQTNTQLATQNVINSVELGTILRVLPRLEEVANNSGSLVRTRLYLSQVTAAGDQKIPQTITVGTSSATIVAEIPNLNRMKYEGELLMKDGDLLIVGGQKEDSSTVSENGLPGSSGPTLLGGLTGTRFSNTNKQTTYFALQVRVNKKQ